MSKEEEEEGKGGRRSSTTTSTTITTTTIVHIHAHTPLRVCYGDVRREVPGLLFPATPTTNTTTATAKGDVRKGGDGDNGTRDGGSGENTATYDMVVFIGMASKQRGFFTLEQQAHRDGYTGEDVDDKTMKGDHYWKCEYGAPEVLRTGIDIDDVWRRWKRGLEVSDTSAYLSKIIMINRKR